MLIHIFNYSSQLTGLDIKRERYATYNTYEFSFLANPEFDSVIIRNEGCDVVVWTFSCKG